VNWNNETYSDRDVLGVQDADAELEDNATDPAARDDALPASDLGDLPPAEAGSGAAPGAASSPNARRRAAAPDETAPQREPAKKPGRDAARQAAQNDTMDVAAVSIHGPSTEPTERRLPATAPLTIEIDTAAAAHSADKPLQPPAAARSQPEAKRPDGSERNRAASQASRAAPVEDVPDSPARSEPQSKTKANGADRAASASASKARDGQPETSRVETKERAAPVIESAPQLPAESKAVAKRPSDGAGGNGKGPTRDGSGGGGGGGKTPIEKRASEREFRQVLSSSLAHCRRNLVTVAIFSFAVNTLILAVPIFLFNVSDRVLTSRSTDTLVMLTLVVLGALVAHVLLDMIRRFMLMRIAVDVESRLGAPVLSAAAKASQNGSSREFQTLGDLQQLRAFLTGSVLLTMLDVPVAPLYLLLVFLIHPHLGWIVTSTGVLLLILAAINQRLTAMPFGVSNAFATRANLQADAMARNAQVINAMGMIPEAVSIWGRDTAESLRAQVRAQDRNVIMTGVSKFVRLCTQVAILGWGAWLALESELTGGMMIAASIVASRALAPVEGTIEGWKSFVQARSSYGRIKALLQNSPLNLDRLRLPRPQGRLNVERILYVPPPTKKVILNGITFQLEPGESLAIVGSSGAGKSTLGRMLVGSIAPTAGNVRLDMMDLRTWDSRQFGENVGYLPQEVQLFPASIKANIARMREDATDEDIFNAAEIADVHEMISQFPQGYETQIAVDGSPLSGGQKQRIGLARAFFGSPRMVVLDEPNSNLDVPGERALARALQLAKERQITVVAITQRPSLLKSVDKILIIKDGGVQALGKRDEMLPLLSAAAARQRNKDLPKGTTDPAPLFEQ
jgi:ATP-binding cassette subfamily C protein